MSQTLHQSEAIPSTQTLPPLTATHDDSLPRELLEQPLDREIERIESLLASCLWRQQQEEVRQ